MTNVFHTLMKFAKDFLDKSASNAKAVDESEIEFAEYMCESMVNLGSSNLYCLARDHTMLPLYFEQVLLVSPIQTNA